VKLNPDLPDFFYGVSHQDQTSSRGFAKMPTVLRKHLPATRTSLDGQTRLTNHLAAKRSHDSPAAVRRNGLGPEQRCLVGQTRVFLTAGRESFRNRRYHRHRHMFNRHNGPLKGYLQNFIHGFDKVYRKAGENFLRDIR
jgi:hypothetical protein